MQMFSHYIMVDWSGSNDRCAGKENCIWIASGSHEEMAPTTDSPASRTEAIAFILRRIGEFLRIESSRVLVCCDFPYGYPAGFANALPGSQKGVSPWRTVWEYLHGQINDDLNMVGRQLPSNQSNRFAVANEINRVMSSGQLGPFWCAFPAEPFPFVPRKQPAQPFVAADGQPISNFRMTDRQAESDFPFRLFGNGSVGSQLLVGIPRLYQMRFASQFSPVSRVWPFETGWAPADQPWDLADVRVMHAEIYPSVREPLEDKIRDRGQVRAMWHWARDADRAALLQREFAVPRVLETEPHALTIAEQEEGWIVGIPT